MNLEFIPRKQLVDRLNEGWRLIPGHEYSPDETAILMHLPEEPEPVTVRDVWSVFERPQFKPAACSVDGCENIHHASGLCSRHYGIAHRLRYKRPRAPVDQMYVEAGW